MAKKTAKKSSWQKTGVNNLTRNSSGIYYARFKVGGKQVWRSLKTSLKSVAVIRLADLLQKERGRDGGSAAQRGGKMTGADALALREREITNRTDLKPSRHYYTQCRTALLRGWPELAELDLRKVTRQQCEDWAGAFSKSASPTRFNNTLAELRALFAIAIAEGIRYGDPAEKIKRMRPNQKDLDLPKIEDFNRWLAEIDKTTGRFGKACGEFVRFLAFSGLRTGEAANVQWRDCDFDKGELIVRGDPKHRTKNGEIRRVPMIPPLKEHLESMRKARSSEQESNPVLIVNEAKKTMDHAADRVGIAKMTHHDLRHLFATICIESGVDIPTVSRWLGHKDGGALAMKTYGHLRDEHSKQAAQKVEFSAK